MSVNIKISGQTFNGVDTLKVEDATTSGTWHQFKMGLSGTYKVSLSVDGVIVSAIDIPKGKAMSNPYNPTKSGYVFSGWSTVVGAVAPNVTFPYTPTSNVTLYAVFNTVIQYKASPVGYGNSSPSSISFSTNSNLANWTPETVSQGGTNFIKIPTFYRKVVSASGNQITSFVISSWKEDSNFHPYSVFIDENGNLLPYVLIAKDWMSTSSTLANGRAQARAKGAGYQLYDWQFQKLWKDLICAKMQTININSGSGITTDVLGLNWGSTAIWIDGVSYQGSTRKWAICYHPSKYSDQATASTTDYHEVGYASGGTSGQEISKLGYSPVDEFFNYPTSTTSNSSYNTYYCDSFYFGTSPTHPVRSSVGAAYARNGAFRCYADSAWSDAGGVRLCYRPVIS